MVPLGLWIGIVGYGILYAGVVKLAGGTCSLGQAFRGECVPASGSSSGASQSGNTSSSPGPVSGTPNPAAGMGGMRWSWA